MKRLLAHPWPVALFVLALLPRLHELGGPSLAFYDELTTLARSLEPSLADVVAAAARQYPPYIDFQPPLYYLIVHAVIALGHSDFLARLPAALAGAAAAPLLYFLGCRLGGRVCGIFAGAALAVNLHHIDVSQQVRLYALFGTLALAAWTALARALGGGHRRDWGLFALILVLGLYTSYLTAGVLAVAAGLTLLALVRPIGEAPPWRRTATGFAGAVAVALAAVAPWWAATSGMRGFLLDAGTPVRPALETALAAMFAAFSSHYAAFLGRPELPWLLAAPAVAGLALALVLPGRRREAVAVGLIFLIFFGLVWLRANSAHHFQVRYVLPCLFAALLAAGLGLSRLFARLEGRWPAQLLALVLGLALAWPSAAVAPFYYRRDDSRLSTLAETLRAASGPDATLLLWGESDPWTRPYFETFVRWYLPGEFLPGLPGEGKNGRQAREGLVLVPKSPGLTPPAGAVFVAELARAGVWRLPLVNAAPLLPAGRFTADFAPDAAFAQISASRNIRATGQSLILADRGRSGEATYVFTPLPGQTVALTGLLLETEATAYPGRIPSGRVIALVGPDGDSLSPYDAQRPPPPATSLSVRLIFTPGFDRGPVAVTRFALDLAVSGDPGRFGVAAAAESARRLAANTLVADCAPGTVFPGRFVVDATGRPCPDTGRVTPETPLVLGNPGQEPLEPDSLDIAGNAGGATLTLGETRLAVPLAGPAVMTASLRPGETGRAVLAPLFTAEAHDPASSLPGTTAVRLKSEPALSCPDAKPCEIVYELTTGYPARQLDLQWFPRVSSDPEGRNGVVAEVSVAGGDYRRLDACASTRSGRWEGLGVRRRASLDLGGMVGTVRLRFRLSGDGAQLWSAPETPLTLALSLDTRSLPELGLPPGRTPLAATCPGPCDLTVGFGLD